MVGIPYHTHDFQIPTSTTQEIRDGVQAGKVITPDQLKPVLDEKAVAARTLTAGTGLTGGGDSTADRTVALNSASIASLAKADTAVQPSQIRELLTADRTYYVRTDGSDSNTGLANTAGGAFATIQKAIDVAATLDLSIYNVTIQVGAGTYASSGLVAKRCVGAGSVIVVGDETTPSNVVLAITVSGGTHGFDSRAMSTAYAIRGVRMTCSGGTAATAALNAEDAELTYQAVEFSTGWGFHVRAGPYGRVGATGNYSITAAATAHWRAQTGQVTVQSRTITITGTPAITNFANCNNLGMMLINSNTFSGGATGGRYTVSLNGVIQTSGGGASYLPGDGTGTTATGGQYA